MGEWRGGEHVDLGPSGAIAAADYALRRFADLGVRLPPDNRLQRARRLLERVNSRALLLAESDPEMLRKVTEAQWTCLDFYLIGRASAKHMSDEHVRKIEIALGGGDIPEQDKNHLARNTQFELYVAAILAMGDMRVALAEPDLQLLLQGELVGIAAKRVQSAGALARRVKEAVEQITRAGGRGLIAVNADVIMIGKMPLGDAVSKGQTLDEELAELHRLDDALMHEPAVVGRIAFARTAAWDFPEGKPVLTQDMYRQYRIFASDPEGELIQQELSIAEGTIANRLKSL